MDGSVASIAPRYRAFLSYSHQDEATAAWLHRALETYRIPSKLVGTITSVGEVPHRLTPLFRDREELSASHDLNGAIQDALQSSMFLIVLCSPAAATSRWVNEEILTFKRLHGDERVLALIIRGEPNALASREGQSHECFPPALRYRLGSDGELSNTPAEPIAADLRPGGDGKRLSKLKLASGLTGVRLDDLVQRETQRRIRRLMLVASTAVIGMIFSAGLALYANSRRVEANKQRDIANREALAARAASDFLVGTFVLSNPAAENPREITALTILARSAERAKKELADQPAIQVRLATTIGRAYNNLGLFGEARALLEGLGDAVADAGADGANAKLALAMTYLQLGLLEQGIASVDDAERMLGPAPDQHTDVRANAALTRGIIYAAQGEISAGLVAFERALRLYRISGEADSEKIATTLVAQGMMLSDAGRFDEAERSLMQALAIHRRVSGELHRSTGQTWFMLAQNAFLAGDLGLAESRITNALIVERKMLDADNPIVADSLSMQGQIFHGQGRLLEAEKSLEEAIAIYEKAFGGPHYLIGIAQIYLALVESERGRTAKALAILDEAKRNYDASYGKLHANHGDLLVNRATILARAGRRKEAVADCAAGMKILDQTLGADAAFTKQLGEVCAKI